MTLLAYNGFEGYADPYDQRDSADFIASMSRSSGMVNGTGRNGGKSLKFTGDSVNACTVILSPPPIDNSKVSIMGVAFKVANFPGNTQGDFIRFQQSDFGQGFSASLSSSGNLQLRAEAISLYDYYDFQININQWYYLEVKVKVHATSGICIVHIDEQEVFNYSGVLYFSGNTTINTLSSIFYYNSFLELDDIYVADDQGTENNNFLGDIRIDAIHPSGAGNYAQMTPSAGNNYECVDETEMDDTDYVEGANAAEKDSYAYGSVPTDLDDSAIIGLQTKNNCLRTGTASNIKIDPFIRTGSTDYSQTAQDLPDSVGMVSGDIVIEDPSDSLIWTQAKINACEFGMEVG